MASQKKNKNSKITEKKKRVKEKLHWPALRKFAVPSDLESSMVAGANLSLSHDKSHRRYPLSVLSLSSGSLNHTRKKIQQQGEGEGIDFKRKRNDSTEYEESRGINQKSHHGQPWWLGPGLARHLLTKSKWTPTLQLRPKSSLG
ncbi:hypothetical protein M9H77_08464 [Catharanthus roseus]|uniref:Uncharacterized protein n=1 Tax=Catharanthus roseus TaxID=4058 RepID=A0ACC0BY16_CATRO|nr:hypothetical protein M9H77_08464 [Catharanthus roseus]